MSERCSFCILPTGLPGLTLDQSGKCKYCRASESLHVDKTGFSHEQMKQRFESIIQRFKGKGKYECLVPLSGGKESCYILYVLVKEYNMRPLAFNFSNGFQHPDAIRNIENIVNQLGVDLVIYRPDPHLMRNLYHAFLSKAGEFCTPCNMLISATGFRLARQNGIRMIMSGNAMQTAPGLEGFSAARYYDRAYYLNVAKDILKLYDRDYYINPPYFRTAIRRLVGANVKVLNVLEYLGPNLGQIHSTLESIGWTRPAGAIQHGDCLLDPLKDYLYYKRWRCTEVTSLYSVLIRRGEISREEALKRALVEERSEPPSVLPEFLKTIGMTVRDFDDASKKDFRNIPNMRSSLVFRWGKKVINTVERLRGYR